MKISRLALGAAAAAVGMQLAAFAGDLPKGGSVVHGDVSVATETAQVTLDQVSDRAIVNWESFDIGEGCGVRVNQPAMSSAMLSRVVGDDASDILGSLDADGHFYLVNPNGIVFGENASVNVHALTASTLDTTDASFLSGNPVFSGSGGEVHNLGTLTAEVVTLIGSTVRNYGEIDAETHVGLHARSGIPPPPSAPGPSPSTSPRPTYRILPRPIPKQAWLNSMVPSMRPRGVWR